MALMRGDMGGAACVLSAFEAVVRLQLPLHLIVLVALAENMPSGDATKPGDVFKAMNGKTVEVKNETVWCHWSLSIYPLKTSENQRFSDVFKGYRKRLLT